MSDWCLEVWGEYACFTRPEMKVERVSYEVMTPSAARAIFESILWKPAIRWNITRIEVLNPIRWASIRRNEVGFRCSAPSADVMKGLPSAPIGQLADENRQQRASMLLKDVRYRIYANFELIELAARKGAHTKRPETWASDGEREAATATDETPAKYAAMFERRARKGQCFNTPYLGCREFSCSFKLVDRDTSESVFSPQLSELGFPERRDLGYMLYDMDFSDPANPRPQFFRASIDHGNVVVDRSIVEVVG